MRLFSSFISLITLLVLLSQCQTYADTAVHKTILSEADNAVLQQNNEIANSKYYPSYHLASSLNAIMEPGGFVYFKGNYHLFYQQIPFAKNEAKTYIGHSISPDLIHWKTAPFALAPSENYDFNKTTTGSAIVADDLIYLVYTGESETDEKVMKETQNLAMSKDGINFGKSANNPIIKIAPHYAGINFSSEKFRTPYVWKHNDKYYALIGSMFEKTQDGAAVLYKSDDLRNWIFVNVTAIGSKGEMGNMWEYPQLLKIDNDDLLSVSLEGIEPKNKMFLNKYNSGWFIGKLDYNSGKFKQKTAFGLYDHGFDFYAPQIIQTSDKRNILTALLGMPNKDSNDTNNNWSGMMTIPREIYIENEKVVSVPLKELSQLRTNPIYYKNQKVVGTKVLPQLLGNSYELEILADLTNANNFAIKLLASAEEETIISYNKETKILALNRDKSSTEHPDIKGEREILLPLKDDKLKLQIFVDKSSVEIFANDGQAVMSTRVFPKENSKDIVFTSNGEAKLQYINFYTMKAIR